MHLPALLLFLSGVFVTLTLASPTPELYSRADTAPKQDESVKCGVCLSESSPIIFLCGIACGPGGILGPLDLHGQFSLRSRGRPEPGLPSIEHRTDEGDGQDCLTAAGASQQGIQCAEACQRTNGHTRLLEDCSQAKNTCTGASMFFGSSGGRIAPQGLCTIPEFAGKPSNAGGECFGIASTCDLAVSATKDCKPVLKITRDNQAPAFVPNLGRWAVK